MTSFLFGHYCHGTATMGIIAGDDDLSLPDGAWIGMAPNAQWIHCLGCPYGSCHGSDTTACAQWFLVPGGDPDMRPHVVNHSWGSWAPDDCDGNMFAPELQAYRAADILPAFAAGNVGDWVLPPHCWSSTSPANNTDAAGNPLAFASGAHGSDGSLDYYSSGGPSACNNDNLFPDLVAPGLDSCTTQPGDAYYCSFGGTSSASPHTAGCVALVRQAAPWLTVDEVEQVLRDAADDVDDGCGTPPESPDWNNKYGEGHLDCYGAVKLLPIEVGTLTGMVYDADTSASIVGALVQASLSPTQTFSTSSGSGGIYGTIILSGTYTVTGSAYGYMSNSIPGVTVISDTTTTQDIPLTPAPSYVVEGTVTDATTGWPLYASIEIDGYPGDPVWTDPVTGYYSVVLAGGITYIFNVEAWVPGYDTASRSIGPLTGDQTENFALDADLVACVAPGYELPYIFDNFESGYGNWTMTGLWNGENEADACGSLVAPFPSSSNDTYYGIDGGCTYDNGSANSGELTMVAPVTLPSSGNAILSFWSYEETECGGGSCGWDARYLDISTDNGSTWVEIWTSSGPDGAWYPVSVDLTPYLGSNALIRFRFDTVDDAFNDFFGWMVDDVGTTSDCNPTPGGLVVGNVYDQNTSGPVVGADVVNDSGEATTAEATPDDPALDDAFYTLFSPTGSHVFTATMSSYGPDVQTPTVVQGDTVQQDFNLPAGWLAYAPPTLEATLDMGMSTTVAFTLSNGGGLSASFELREEDQGFDPAVLLAVEVPGYQVPAAGELASTYAGDRLVSRESWSYQPSEDAFISGIPASVLLVAAADATQIQAMLQAYPDISVVDYYDARLGTPTLAELLAYDTAIVISNNFFADPVAMGDVLADYIDAGGTVIQTVPTFYDPGLVGWGLQGRFVDEGYSPFIGTGDWFLWADLGSYDPTHPIMQGVTAAGDFLRQVVDLATGADWVADWTDDEFIATKDSVVALNTLLPDGYYWTGDVDLIVHNSVIWLQTGGDVPWLFEDPISGTVAAGGGDQIIDITFDAGVPEVTQPGDYYAALWVDNDTPYAPPEVPVAMTVLAPADWGKAHGYIMDNCTGEPVEDALIDFAGTYSTTSDADGYYAYWMPQATYAMEVSAAGYLSATDSVGIVAGQTVQKDFDLIPDWPCIAVEPDLFEVWVLTGTLVYTHPNGLDITNNGGQDLDFEIWEMDGGYTPTGLLGPVVGEGEWLSRGEGVSQPTNLGTTRVSEPGVYYYEGANPSQLSILVCSDSCALILPDTCAEVALQNLGETYTLYYMNWSGCEAAINSGTYDLAIIDNACFFPADSLFTALDGFLTGGGQVMINTFDMDAFPANPLWANAGVVYASDVVMSPPPPVYRWDSSHPVVDDWSAGPLQFDDPYIDDGDKFDALAGTQLLAGYTAAPGAGEGAFALRADNRAMVSGFCIDNLVTRDQDGDGTLDCVEVWQEGIAWMLNPPAADVPWIWEDPVSGTVPASTMDNVDIYFTAVVTDPLPFGTYTATLRVLNNDPVAGTQNVLAIMHIIEKPEEKIYLPIMMKNATR